MHTRESVKVLSSAMFCFALRSFPFPAKMLHPSEKPSWAKLGLANQNSNHSTMFWVNVASTVRSDKDVATLSGTECP